MPAPRILILDDDPALLDALTQTFKLRFPAAVVDCTSSPHDAQSAIQNGQYDLVICDVKMPHMDGVELLRRLKAAQTGTPVVVVTAAVEEGLVEAATEQGAKAVLRKPLDRDDFFRVIRAILDKPDDTAGPSRARLPTRSAP